MSQLEVNNESLDCAESRTVRSLQTLRQQHQQKQCNAHTNYIYGSADRAKLRCASTCHPLLLGSNKAQCFQQQQSTQQGNRSCKTKSYVLLPIIFFAIFVQSSHAAPATLSGKRLILHTSEYRQRQHQELLERERAAYAQPTPLHHRHHLHLRSLRGMSMNGGTPNGNENGNEYCRQVMRALEDTLRQANATYCTLRNLLDNFVREQYSSTTSEVQEMWRLHKLNLDHPYRSVLDLEHDVDQMPAADAKHFGSIIHQPISEAMISAELVKVYTTLTILDKVLTQLIDTRKANHSQLLHDFGQERLRAINTFFEEAARHVSIELEETKQAMAKLRIALPELVEPVTYNVATSAKEWLIASEHLKVVQYLRQLYTILLSKCPAML